MQKYLRMGYILFFVLFLSACGTKYDGSRTGNESQFIMEYNILNTTDSQNLTLESGDRVSARIVVDSGKLSIRIQKDNDEPVYECEEISASDNFDFHIQKSGVYTFTVTGEKAKGSIQFVKVAGQREGNETQQEVEKDSIDLSGVFQGINGCAVIYLPAQKKYFFYNEEMCRKEDSPFSTFKIIMTLSGLKNGVIADETSKMNYNGTVYGNPDWNGDLTLKEAFQKSCVWYFRQVVDSVGETVIKEELKSLQYGNCDTSEWRGSNLNPIVELNGFWLDSSLKISPVEQVEVLKKIFEGQSNYDNQMIEILKNIMLVDENSTRKTYGKTGTGINGEAWFVGFSESGGSREYFAIFLDDSMQKKEISGSKAKEIALEIFN